MTKIDIHTLSVPDQADGFIGYWAKGHHEPQDFIIAITSQIDENDFRADTKLDSFFALPPLGHKVKQCYYRIIPDKESGWNLLHKASKGKGAFPVTILEF